MRLIQLNIAGFGKIVNQQIMFDKEMNLVHGANEAGKSTIYAFIKTLLFGFPRRQANIKDYQPKFSTIYGGELIMSHPTYGEVKICRYKSENKGKAKVFLDDGSEANEKFLASLLAPLTEEVFDSVYRLEQNQLANLNGLTEDNFQRLLLTIGLTGSKRLLDYQQQLKTSMSKIYLPSGTNPEMNQLLKEYEALRIKIAKQEKQEAMYRNKLYQKESLAEDIKIIQTGIKEDSLLLQRMNQQISLFNEWQDYTQVKEQLKYGLGDIEQEEFNQLVQIDQVNQILQKQEFSLTEDQLKYTAKTESEALAFYLNHESDFQQFMKDQPFLEGIHQELKQSKISLEEKVDEQTRFRQHLQLASNQKVILPSKEKLRELQEISKKEKNIALKKNQYQEQVLELLKQKERISDKYTPRKQQKAQWNLLALLGSVATLIVSLVDFINAKNIGIDVFLLIVSIFLGGYYFYDSKKNRSKVTSRFQGVGQINDQIEETQQGILHIESEQEDINKKKNYFIKEYQFSSEKTIDNWLDELPIRDKIIKDSQQTLELEEKIKHLNEQLQIYMEQQPLLTSYFNVSLSSIGESIKTISQFIYEMQQNKQQYMLENSENYQAFDSVKNVREQKNALYQDNADLLIKHEITDLSELPMLIQGQQKFTQLKSDLSALAQQLSSVFDLTRSYKLEALVEHRDFLEESLAETKDKLAHLQQEFETLKFSIHKLEEDGLLSDLYQDEANLRGEINLLQDEWIIEKNLLTLSEDIQNYLGTQQLPSVVAMCSNYFKQLTLGEYTSTSFAQGKLQVTHRNGQIYQLGELSTGTKDQLIMAMRLAFIYNHSEEQLSPLIMDDSWLHYDQKRKEALFSLLKEISGHVQVICFSSDQALLEYSKQEEIEIIGL